MNKKEILISIIAFICTIGILFLASNPNVARVLGIKNNKTPQELYHVYLSGKSLGIIKSQEELENYIDSKQDELKKKYSVDKIYAPNDLSVVKELTYNEKIVSVEDIYEKIEDIKGTSSFTLDGYKIQIKGVEREDNESESYTTEDIEFYVIDKTIFTDSIDKTVTAFIENEEYKSYISDIQKELKDNETGKIIEDITIKNNIVIKEQRIPAGEKIFLKSEDLTKYLLFGTTKEQETYIVQAGDTIEEISEKNQLSPEEFLIINPSYKTTQDLLYPGAVVKLGLIDPQIDIYELDHVVSKKTIQKETVYENDPTQYSGVETVKEEGQDGLSLVTEKVSKVNGVIKDTVSSSSVELIPAVNKVVVRGTKTRTGALGADTDVPVSIGGWVWPTNTPYTITSPFSWRWGKHHDGTDISGPGYGSPIKAINNGIVVQSNYDGYNGNYITIKHSNGYYSYYGHMAARYKQVGAVVMAGDVIGTMGMTGYATGVHLHLGLYNGYPYRGGVAINAMTTVFK